jgi:hypothetical protein
MKTSLIFPLIFITLIGCENVSVDKIYTIILDNNTGNQLFYHVGIDDSPLIYPNINLPENKQDLKLPKITTNVVLGTQTKWKDRFKELPSDTLSIYFFNPDTLSKYSWEEIRENYKVLKKYDLSIQDLEKLNFKVVYPPTPEMSNIRQYPPYK